MAEYPPTKGSNPSSDHIIREARQLAFDELFRSPQIGHSLKIDHSFPEKFVDELSRREVFNKHLFRPNTYLHKWWADCFLTKLSGLMMKLTVLSQRKRPMVIVVL